jgi:hypothetical protein
MRKNPTPQSGFVNPRNLFGVLFCFVGVMLAMISFAATPKSLKDRPTTEATPSSGSLSLGTPLLTYTAGPFLISNPSAQAGDPDCVTLPCDEYTLTVVGAPNLGTTHNVVVTIQWDVAAEDYDLYIRQGGADIKSAASSSDPEVATIDANPGVYTIRVIPFAVAGSSFNGKIELVPKPTSPPPPPPGPGTPRYHNFAATGTLGNSAGEPSLGVGKPVAGSPDGRTMYIAGLQTLRVTWNDCSSPASGPGFPANPPPDLSNPLWEDVSALNTSVVSLDPILFTDFVTGRTFASQLAAKCSNMSFSDNDGGVDGLAPGDWIPSQGCGINAGVDHQSVGGGPFKPGLPDGTALYANAVYYASQDIAIAQMAISRDGGVTFGPAVPMYNLTQCGGLHGHMKVTPSNAVTQANGHAGTVYMPNKGCGGTQGVIVSENEGLTWTVRTVPFSTPGTTDPSIGIDAEGKVYFAFANGDGHAMVAVSSDKGVNWSIPFDVGTAFSIKNTVFPAAVGGSSSGGNTGRAAVMYLATDTGGNYQQIGVFPGVWHIYAAHTFDGGLTWTTVRVTPENDPVQRGSICTGGTTCGADRNLLDFNDIGVDHEGRTLIAYADGCVGCTSPTGSDSRTDKASIARQSGGKRLFAAFDPNPAEPALPAAPRVDSVTKNQAGVVTVDWSEPDNGGSPLTGYKVYRRTNNGTYGAPVATVTLGCPTCKTDYEETPPPLVLPATGYYYKVTARNSLGDSVNCGEFLVGVAIGGGPCILPGVEILTDQSGDIITPIGENSNPGWDLRSLSIAEPYVFAPDKLVFTIKVENLAVVPPNTRWPIQFTVPGDPNTLGRWVDMSTVPPASPAAPAFRYGTFVITQPAGTYGAPATVLGNAEVTSTFSPDGTIRIVVPRSNLGNPAVAQNLTGFLMRVRFGADAFAVTPDNMLDSLAPFGSYTVVGNDPFCRPNLAPIAALAASPLSGKAPLLVNFNASGSSDPDTLPPADTIASYTFNFGDGSAEVTQPSPLISHTYNANGAYRATVRVTDSRGKPSDGVAGVTIEVLLPLAKVESRKIHGAKGPFYVTLFDAAQPTNPPQIECRTGGASNAYTLIYTFDGDRVITDPGTATKTQGTSNPPGAPAIGPATNQITVEVTGVTNVQHLIISLNDVEDDEGALLNNVDAKLDVLIGDVTGEHFVNSFDVTQTKDQSGIPVALGNFRKDVTAEGFINSFDVTTVKSKSGTGLP